MTPSPSETPSATASPTLALACVGDCNGSGTVTVDELVVGVSIALGNASLDVCRSFDRDGDTRVETNELVLAVNDALNGCPDGSAR